MKNLARDYQDYDYDDYDDYDDYQYISNYQKINHSKPNWK